MTQYMENKIFKDNRMSKNTIESSSPFVEVHRSQIGATSNVENLSDDYNHVMKCINGLAETVLSYSPPLNLLLLHGIRLRDLSI
jgi:hypothetical protein